MSILSPLQCQCSVLADELISYGGPWRNLTSCPSKSTLCFQDSDSQQTISPIHVTWRMMKEFNLIPLQVPFVFETKLGNNLILSSIWRIVRVTLPRPLRVPIAFQAMPLLQRFSNPHGGRQRSRLAYPFLSTHCLANSAEHPFGLPSIFGLTLYDCKRT